MAAYVSLPIFCFYLFNKPEYFSEFLIRNKHFYFPKDDPHSVSIFYLIAIPSFLTNCFIMQKKTTALSARGVQEG
jgi:hypothetical protein